MRPFGFAIAGTGAIAAVHRDAIRHIPGAKLVAVWSRTASRAEAFAAEAGCAVEPTLERLAGRDDVDAVIITTASGFHLEPALAAAQAGKHILVEKPLEVTTERCDAMIAAAREHNVQLGCIFQSRFAPVNRRVQQAAAAGEFGRLILGDAYVKWYRSQEYYDQGAWRGTWQLDGGGALMNQAIHQVDLLQWIMGPVAWVSAQTDTLAREGIEVEDTAVAVLRFTSGAVGVIEATTSLYPGYPKRLEVHGSGGGAVVVDDVLTEWTAQGASAEENQRTLREFGGGERTGTFADPMALSFQRHKLQIEEFMDAATKGTPLTVDGVEGRKSVALIEAIYQSARTGQPVTNI